MLRSDVRVTARGRTRLHCRRAMSVCAFLVLVMTLTLPLSVLGQTTRKARAEKAARVEKGTQRTPQLSLWVAAYYYPNGPGLREWDRLIGAAKVVPIVAIVNPASGPGDHVDPYIAKVITRLAKATSSSSPTSERNTRASRSMS